MYRILIVEDDFGIADAVSAELVSWQMESRTVSDFRDVMSEFSAFQPHLVLMDITLPYMNGYHWCSEIRRVSSVPVIFISSASDNMNVVMALSMGGDDFISKPFEASVLIAKIQALLRRTYDFGTASPVIECGGAILNTGDCSLTFEEQKIVLSKNEYRILLTLMQNKGKVVSREKLMSELWDTNSFIGENTLSVNLTRLRKKLDEAGLSGFISTKHGVGYIVGE